MPIEIVTEMSGLPSTGNRWRCDERAQLLGQDRAVLDVGLGQDQHELLAAVAADHVGRPQVLGDRLGDAAQDVVAGGVPYVSLTALKWSMSTKATDSGRS